MLEKEHMGSIFNVFLDVMLCSFVDKHQRTRGTYCLHLQATLKLEGVSFSETSVCICQTTLSYPTSQPLLYKPQAS